MATGIIGSYFGKATANTDLIPIFRGNELSKHPDSFLRNSAFIIKKIAISAPSGTIFTINGADFLMPSNSFELGYDMVDIEELAFKQDTNVTITYVY